MKEKGEIINFRYNFRLLMPRTEFLLSVFKRNIALQYFKKMNALFEK